MSVIFFFSAVISILYFLGWMQVLIEKMALIMQYSLGTSAMESLHAAVNVFVGWVSTCMRSVELNWLRYSRR